MAKTKAITVEVNLSVRDLQHIIASTKRQMLIFALDDISKQCPKTWIIE